MTYGKMMRGGFYSEEHSDDFYAASLQTRLGHASRDICGARNRHGNICSRVPITEGRGRCLLHCGPKAANQYRERQRRDFLRGKVSAAEWRKYEARRAANRLRDLWKKSPWSPGSTIDLGCRTADFDASLREYGSDPHALAPAVLDWAKWKFRRFQLDRRDDDKWRRVVMLDLPVRVRDAGPRPVNLALVTDVGPAPFAVDPSPAAFSKRNRPDQPKAPPKVRVRKQFYRGRPRKHVAMAEDEEQELALFQVQHRAALQPLYEKCRTQQDRLNVLHALRAFVADPNDKAATARWMAVLEALKPI